MYVDRFYRDSLQCDDLADFRVAVKETDLYIRIGRTDYSQRLVEHVERLVLVLRHDLEMYIKIDPEFKTTLTPHIILPEAPPIAQLMAQAGNSTGVGPMAAVAGAFSEMVGKELSNLSSEVIVENGGDIFLASNSTRLISVFAGLSVFSNRLAIEVPAGKTPLGICTSSGTVGPSLSFGKADAAVVVAVSPALADAAASAVGNAVKTVHDVEKGIEIAKSLPNVLGALVIKDDKLAAWGEFNIVPVSQVQKK